MVRFCFFFDALNQPDVHNYQKTYFKENSLQYSTEKKMFAPRLNASLNTR